MQVDMAVVSILAVVVLFVIGAFKKNRHYPKFCVNLLSGVE